MINEENYEAYFLDYIEGNLSPMDTDMLLSFLENNPLLKDELSDYSEINLIPTKSSFNINNLIKTDLINDSINTSNFEEFAIANLENDLTSEKNEELNSFIAQNQPLKKDFTILNKTILTADKTIIYAEKENLKKVIPFFLPYYRIATVAAIILLMFTFGLKNWDIKNNSGSNKDIKWQASNTSLEKKRKKNDNLKVEKVIINSENNNELIRPNNIITSTHTKSPLITIDNKNTKQLASNFVETENITFQNNRSDNKQINNVNSRLINISKNYKSTRTLAKAIETNNNLLTKPKTSTSTIDENNYLSPKEFLATIFKKKVLKSDSDGISIEAEDFNSTLASATNNKISLIKSNDNSRLLSIQTKNFSFQKKLRN